MASSARGPLDLHFTFAPFPVTVEPFFWLTMALLGMYQAIRSAPEALAWVTGVLRLHPRARVTIAGGGILLSHAERGGSVGEHGTGGVEHSIVLMAACLVLAAAEPGRPAPC